MVDAKKLRELVRQKFPRNSYAVFDEVRSETGYTVGVPVRSLDMLAMSLWRSGDLELHGFELKVSRADWLRELRQPDKSEAIAKYVDRFWIVTSSPRVVVDVDEVPVGWGLMVAGPHDVWLAPALDLHVIVKAPKREAQPLDRRFIASLMRKVSQQHAEEAANG